MPDRADDCPLLSTPVRTVGAPTGPHRRSLAKDSHHTAPCWYVLTVTLTRSPTAVAAPDAHGPPYAYGAACSAGQYVSRAGRFPATR